MIVGYNQKQKVQRTDNINDNSRQYYRGSTAKT
jgi:hypothetical protein